MQQMMQEFQIILGRRPQRTTPSLDPLTMYFFWFQIYNVELQFAYEMFVKEYSLHWLSDPARSVVLL